MKYTGFSSYLLFKCASRTVSYSLRAARITLICAVVRFCPPPQRSRELVSQLGMTPKNHHSTHCDVTFPKRRNIKLLRKWDVDKPLNFGYFRYNVFFFKEHCGGTISGVHPGFSQGGSKFVHIGIVASRVRNINLTQAHYSAAGLLSPPT